MSDTPYLNIEEIMEQIKEARERLIWKGITANAIMLSPKLYQTIMPVIFSTVGGQEGISFSGDPAIIGLHISNGGPEMPPDVDFLLFRSDNVHYSNEEDRTAKWMNLREDVEVTFMCTHCHFVYTDSDPDAEPEYLYCPHCGYRMENVIDKDAEE